MVESFPTKMVKSDYCCGVDMWLSLLITISFSTCTFRFFWFAVEKNRLQFLKIVENVIFNYNCKLETYSKKGGVFY
jgi:hypothetical protein